MQSEELVACGVCAASGNGRSALFWQYAGIFVSVATRRHGYVARVDDELYLGGSSLIRVAYARDADLAAPVYGRWVGEASDFLDMDVSVQVRRIGGE